MEIFFTARFLRSLKKLPKLVQDEVIISVEEFKHIKNHQKLNLHKLHGKMKVYYAFSANFSYRVVVKIEKTRAYIMDVGTHEAYK